MKAAASQKSQITRDEVVAWLAEVVASGPVSGANPSLRDKLIIIKGSVKTKGLLAVH